jgi:hypothetical protein
VLEGSLLSALTPAERASDFARREGHYTSDSRAQKPAASPKGIKAVGAGAGARIAHNRFL